MGLVQYVKLPSVEAGMMYLEYRIQNVDHGDFARWHSKTDLVAKQAYKNAMAGIKWDITKQFIKEPK